MCFPVNFVKFKTSFSTKHLWAAVSLFFSLDFCKLFVYALYFFLINDKWTRSSRSQIFFKIGIVKIFENFVVKHLCWSLFLIKLEVWRSAVLLKRDSNTGVFLWNMRNFEEHLFFTEHSRWLLLMDYQTDVFLKFFRKVSKTAVFKKRFLRGFIFSFYNHFITLNIVWI